MYTVELEKFEGPLDLLLQLIEGEKLDICEVSLSKITDTYLAEIEKIKKTDDEISEFVVIAAKLLYIKSKQLLPSARNEEDEKEIAELEASLIEYQKYKEAAETFKNILGQNERSFSRRVKLQPMVSFLPPRELDGDILRQIFLDIMAQLKEKPEEKTVERVKVSIEDKKQAVLSRLGKGRVSFKSLFAKETTKTEVIVTFLAILEMIKQKEIKVKQDKNFADFIIHSVKCNP